MARDLTSTLRMPPARVSPTKAAFSPTVMVAIIAMIVAALYFGQEILVPLALAILVSFALAPFVIRLRKWGLGRVPSVLAVVLLLFALLIGFGSVVAIQIVDLADNLPTYEYNIRNKIRSVKAAAPDGGVVERTSEMLRDLNQELKEATEDPVEGTVGRATPEGRLDVVEAVPVEVREPEPPPLQALQDVTGPLIGPLTTGGLVLVFVIFMLLQREDLRDRLIRLVGSHDVRRTTEAMDDAGQRISRYLLMQLIINILYGIPVGVGLYLIGVPNPILWGLLATVLRFVPYLGPAIAALFPIALSFAVDSGWTMPLLTIGLFLMLELFSNNVLEPWLYGSSTGLSPVAVIVAAVFWTMLWGPIGLLLATPLTVCLVVLGHHVPQLQFFDVLLGNEPALPAEVKFYQRMLARDPDEAAELAEEYIEDKPLADVYDAVIVPALGFADQDRLRGGLDREAVRGVSEDALEVIDYLAEEEITAEGPTDDGAAAVDRPSEETPILCIGARNCLDEAAAAMLAHLLARRGLSAKVLPNDVVSIRKLSRLERDGVTLICLSYVNPAAVQHARRLIRRLRQHFGPNVRLMVGLWNAELSDGEPQEVIAAMGADLLATSLRQGVRQVETEVKTAAPGDVPSSSAV
ncbi:AI-2E family transporter [Rhodospirillaceae bacterium SYSU D60014]|uniref:AI-2E family transporter n=1 Tax=Virgifigura deserti TaxID=2268457 RepID=UPI000E66F14A